ncbi:MAG: inorganic phosphate transporter [Janthinobacterium lividum]
MLVHFAPSSGVVLAMLTACFVLVLLFEATNGFHDTSNAVATVIYTNALKPVPAVLWSGLLNFLGVMVGGIAVAYALVEILPPDVLTPPDGAPSVPMLVSIFATALFWNVLTWALGIPNSSSHCIIGALIGVACGDALLQSRTLAEGVDWHQIIVVLEALALSPVIGLLGAGGLYGLLRVVLPRGGHLFEPPEDGLPPVWWLRGLLVLTCTGVSFSHGTNDGQKSIGLIMLTVIGLMPATYALNPNVPQQMAALGRNAAAAIPLVERYGDDRKERGLNAARALQATGTRAGEIATNAPATQPATEVSSTQPGGPGSAVVQPAPSASVPATRAQLRGDVYDVLAQLKHAGEVAGLSKDDKAQVARLRAELGPPVQYAPIWVRVLSALCLGLGTMVGYKRIVKTLGERLGRGHMTPGQGASAELVGAVLIGTAGFTGLPVSTTHIITSGITGTMLTGGQGVQGGMLVRIALAWLFTLPVTIVLAGGLFYVLDNPRF